MSDLLAAASASPLLLAILVVVGSLVYAVEKLGGVNGPISRAITAWQGRELRKLRREALLRAERRRIEREDADAERAELIDEVRRLRALVDERTAERDTARRAAAAHPVLPTPRLPEEPRTAPIPGRHRRESARGAAPTR